MKAKYLRHRPATLALLCFFGAGSAGVARADIVTIGTTAFAGVETNLQTVGNLPVPYTDTFGRVIDNANGLIQATSGLYVAVGDTATFSNLAADTTEIGFSLFDFGTNIAIHSVTLSNGDSVNVGAAFENDAFLSFTSTTPFTSASVTFENNGNIGNSGYITDFRTTSVVSGVPEPASLFLLATMVAVLMTGLRRRLRNRPIF